MATGTGISLLSVCVCGFSGPVLCLSIFVACVLVCACVSVLVVVRVCVSVRVFLVLVSKPARNPSNVPALFCT